jgi:hypothetical protein
MPATRPTLYAYGRDSLNILKLSLQLCQQGQRPFYRVAALQLRLLLCDTTRRHNRVVSTAVLPQLFPTLTLPPVDPGGEKLPLKDWLAQPMAGQALTIREFIRRVCDQDGGAHVDFKPEAGLEGLDPAKMIRILGEIVADNVDLDQALGQAKA